MKSIFQLTIFFLLSLFSFDMKAQENDGISPIKLYEDTETGLQFTVGGRFMADAAYFKTDYSPMNSGFSITEARIRTSLTYKEWYFYADFDFNKGDVNQKNIFLRYNFNTEGSGIHSLKAGYFNEASTMALNTSKYNLHFMTRAASALALSPAKSLGISYKYYSPSFFAEQGVYAENKYNNQESGSQGFSASARWIYKPFAGRKNLIGHIGVTARFANIGIGKQKGELLETELVYGAPLETKVDDKHQFLQAKIPWAKRTLNLGLEGLFATKNFFARGEYFYNTVYKDRPDQELFTSQLGGLWSWTTLKSWQAGNPIRTSSFHGGYIELGHLLKGESYGYNDEYSVLGGCNKAGDLEVVARYSFTNLDDINDGDLFLIGNKKFYPNGVISDYPPAASSIAGGKLHNVVIGLNYTFNKHAKVMGSYQFSSLENVYFPEDKNIHTLQARLLFSF